MGISFWPFKILIPASKAALRISLWRLPASDERGSQLQRGGRLSMGHLEIEQAADQLLMLIDQG